MTDMSRISAEECAYTDMEWYGADRKGQVAVFCSAGTGALPEFVCADRERADALIDYFAAREKSCRTALYFQSTPAAMQTAEDFSDKGLFYFDADDGSLYGTVTSQEYYTKRSAPS